MAARPLVLPDTFDGSADWDEWISHFENVAAVNAWEADAQLQWLKVRLTGKAATAFRRLTEDNRATFEAAKAALTGRFAPASRKHRCQAELHTRRRRRGETWADFADVLQSLADKAYPGLQEEAKERLALTAYLGQLDHAQVALGVKQRNPETLDDAVSATLEMEAYLPSAQKSSVSSVAASEDDVQQVAAVAPTQATDKLVLLVEKLVERVERLEEKGGANRSRKQTGNGRQPLVCWKCQKPGHIAKNCRTNSRQQQGN